jgi:hypothetical protein
MTKRAQFLAEANRRLRNMKKRRAGILAAEVFEYLTLRGKGKLARRPKSRKLA